MNNVFFLWAALGQACCRRQSKTGFSAYGV